MPQWGNLINAYAQGLEQRRQREQEEARLKMQQEAHKLNIEKAKADLLNAQNAAKEHSLEKARAEAIQNVGIQTGQRGREQQVPEAPPLMPQPEGQIPSGQFGPSASVPSVPSFVRSPQSPPAAPTVELGNAPIEIPSAVGGPSQLVTPPTQQDQMRLEDLLNQRKLESMPGVSVATNARLVHPVTGKPIAEGNPPVASAESAEPAELRVLKSVFPNFDSALPEEKIAMSQRWNATKSAASSRNIDPLSPEGIKARVDLMRQMPRTAGLAPIVIQTEEGPQIIDRISGQSRPITNAAGETLGVLPTAQQRNLASSMKRIDPIMNQISSLSEKINTQQGLIAKISGSVERAKAQANYNDDVAVYESLISGFTPLVARALGHVGVLTEQDVQSVKAVFPKPGDSKTLRDRKIAQIKSLVASLSEMPAGGASNGFADPLGIR